MKKYGITFLAALSALYLSCQQVAFASFGGGSSGGGGSVGGGAYSGGSESGHLSPFFFLLILIGPATFFVGQYFKKKRIKHLEESLQFNVVYRRNLKLLFIDFQKCCSTGNIDELRDQMTEKLFAKNQKLLEGYANKGIEARTTDVLIRNVYPIAMKDNLLTVEYDASAHDYFVKSDSQQIASKTGVILKSQDTPKTVLFTERWVIDVSDPDNFVVHSVKRG
ncbi:hypothetical protein [Eupransor demetentiae]|uniref:Tim44-like domain-containing protein n=1 Tax=Eupransor demetentiae TaxID=3109584 RepID=A0ABM9N4D8_9LACO|nr:hypothetical protein R54876_GBNLAHCA_00589 [Lactobacillaceae bacterium LMG 33000]